MAKYKHALGDAQIYCLENLQNYGGYFKGCGWMLYTRSRTILVLDALKRRRLCRSTGTGDDLRYEITAYGQHVLSVLNPARFYDLHDADRKPVATSVLTLSRRGS